MIWKQIKRRVQNLDAYQKLDKEYQEKTVFGGAVTVLCWITISLLCTIRIQEYFTNYETEETIFVDTSRSPKLRINLDIVFYRISCSYLSLDAMDFSGEQHLHIDHNVFKRRLDLSGNPITELDPIKEHVASSTTKKKTSDVKIDSKCGSCYGAENPMFNITCCNTCTEVREAYRLKRWQLEESKVEQCKDQPHVIQAANAFKEGCHIYGHLTVNRVAGSFHIAPGRSFSQHEVHVHDVQPFSSSSFNTSHYINLISFDSVRGESEDNSDVPDHLADRVYVNPLGGYTIVSSKAATMYNYYMKIVPTLVKTGNQTVYTYQFSVTKHEKVVSPSTGDSGMPGAFFSYEISALMHQVTEKTIPLSHVVRDILSIIGGVWIFFRFIDYIFYFTGKSLEQKIDLGKAG